MNIETVFRINDLLIKRKQQINFKLEKIEGEFTLTFYNRKQLAEIIFNCLKIKYEGFYNSLSFVNFPSVIRKRAEFFEVNFNFDQSSQNPFIDRLAEELEYSFNLVLRSQNKNSTI